MIVDIEFLDENEDDIHELVRAIESWFCRDILYLIGEKSESDYIISEVKKNEKK